MKELPKIILRAVSLPFFVYLANDEFLNISATTYTNYGIDTYFHILGGFSIAFGFKTILNYLEDKKIIIIKERLWRAFLIISVVSIAALLWEVYEFMWDLLYHTANQPSQADTIKDLLCGLLGGMLFNLWKIIKA